MKKVLLLGLMIVAGCASAPKTKVAPQVRQVAPDAVSSFHKKLQIQVGWLPYKNAEVINVDGSNQRQLTNDPGIEGLPAWSPDGQTIAFSREDSGNVDIYSVNIDGSNLQRLTSTPSHDTLPTFTANGDIIFRTARTGKWAIWRMAPDGSNPTEIVADACVGQEWAYSRMDAWP